MTFKDSNQAFEAAIKVGRLSADKTQATYAGLYMYMGTDAEGRDLFKCIETRLYDV